MENGEGQEDFYRVYIFKYQQSMILHCDQHCGKQIMFVNIRMIHTTIDIIN